MFCSGNTGATGVTARACASGLNSSSCRLIATKISARANVPPRIRRAIFPARIKVRFIGVAGIISRDQLCKFRPEFFLHVKAPQAEFAFGEDQALAMRFGPGFTAAVEIVDGDPVLDVVEASVELDLLKPRPLVEGVASFAHHFRIPGRAGDMIEQA